MGILVIEKLAKYGFCDAIESTLQQNVIDSKVFFR